MSTQQERTRASWRAVMAAITERGQAKEGTPESAACSERVLRAFEAHERAQGR